MTDIWETLVTRFMSPLAVGMGRSKLGWWFLFFYLEQTSSPKGHHSFEFQLLLESQQCCDALDRTPRTCEFSRAKAGWVEPSSGEGRRSWSLAPGTVCILHSYKFRNTRLGCVCYGDLTIVKRRTWPRIIILKGKVISQESLSRATNKIKGQLGKIVPFCPWFHLKDLKSDPADLWL
jgi:hypothetical protein